MRIHTDTLTANDLYAALPRGVAAYITPKGSRKRAHAFDVTLYVFEKDELHRRFGNSGGYGRSSDVGATWDDWGEWMANLYDLEPSILIGHYQDRNHFLEVTAEDRERIRRFNKPTSLEWRTHSAPWLKDTATLERTP